MTVVTPRPLDKAWKQRLDLTGRQAPDLYENLHAIRDTPHAAAIRSTLEDIGASAVFCVQGVPTIVIASLNEYERDAVVEMHAALWNQGLASLLMVIAGDSVRAFSLSRTPYSNPGDEFERRCLVETLTATADTLALKDIIYGAESGRFWEKHANFFDPKERIDQVLLENLTRSHSLLCDAGLQPDAAQALLIQSMFIAYLEDREIVVSGRFKAASANRADSFSTLLKEGNASFLNALFASLRSDFNGDLFVAPCSFEAGARPPRLGRAHLEVLARFRDGHEGMSDGQFHFWGYDFEHIPIELISAVYDRFLGEREAVRRERGAYYTPMFLADTVVAQIWASLSHAAKDKGDFLDPACGSGVFLVRSFQRLCEHWRETRTSRTIRWDSLLNILSRLHGWDLDSSAVRVAVFSLYIALLEQVDPPDIRQLVQKGKVLPELWGKNFKCQDFFAVEPEKALFDVILGNPPWTSRRGPTRLSIAWCAERGLPMPGKEDAWAFTWKSILHLHSDGLVAFLLPAMGFLHNHSDVSVEARSRLINAARIRRIVNFADLRFQLFDGAIRPAALVIFGASAVDKRDYRFDYWAPKADLNLKVKRLITLSSVDKSLITSTMAKDDPLIFKRRLWMSQPDSKLFNYLALLPKIGSFVGEYGTLRRSGPLPIDAWLVGQGFKPANPERISDRNYDAKHSAIVARTPYLSIEEFSPLSISLKQKRPWRDGKVHRSGFEAGFQGPRVLIPRGVSVAHMRLRAAYVEEPLAFQDIIQAIVAPKGEEHRAKLLTAILNSKIAIWYAFHGTASFGSDRPEVKQAELMRLPFPSPEDVPEPARARRAAESLVAIVDEAVSTAKRDFHLQPDSSIAFSALDELAYDYFCLSKDEIVLIEDAVRYIFPAVQPHRNSFPDIWRSSVEHDRRVYVDSLTINLKSWFNDDQSIHARLEAHNADLAVLKVTLSKGDAKSEYTETSDHAVRKVLAKIFDHLHQPLPGNFQLMPDFRIFEGNDLYLIKPMQLRFWLRSAALADATEIALDLQDFAGPHEKKSHA